MSKASYKDLIVWQKSMDLGLLIYKVTDNFPNNENFGLISQMRRSAVSIPSNVAEGRMRQSRKEFVQFLHIAFGSGAELETQLLFSLRLGYLFQKDFDKVSSLLDEIMRMLNVLISIKSARAS
jgi:four helix bundle protein